MTLPLRMSSPPAWVALGKAAQLAAGAASLVVIAALSVRADTVHEGAIAAGVLGIIWVICVYDARTLLAPNRFVYPGLLFAVGAAFTLGPGAGLDALAGGIVAFVVMLVVALAGRGKMGMGDVKMAALCGVAVGIRGVMPMLVVTFLLGGVIAAVALGSGQRSKSDSMAFTPLLGIAVLVTAFIWPGYLF